jgi:hypothetical protein
MLPAMPPLIPVDGFEPIDGATTKNGFRAATSSAAAADSSW